MLLILFLIKLFNSTLGTYAKKDFSNVVTSKNLGLNGYYKLPDGLMIQWGYSSKCGSGVSIYLNTSFYDTNYSVIANEQINGAQAVVYSIHILVKYTSYFTVRGYYHDFRNVSGDMPDGFFWIAIGRWK